MDFEEEPWRVLAHQLAFPDCRSDHKSSGIPTTPFKNTKHYQAKEQAKVTMDRTEESYQGELLVDAQTTHDVAKISNLCQPPSGRGQADSSRAQSNGVKNPRDFARDVGPVRWKRVEHICQLPVLARSSLTLAWGPSCDREKYGTGRKKKSRLECGLYVPMKS
ncbi:hypothetical protein RRG08_003819 [Elysia crispata]|uniref:Uncharacterized protein n=1 Tax=Elysia crispata TaxID=231223 RepID=A0AAE0ZDX1_9GAST|nr:hypothetical protein RRG08_003819 [Elysia crispata]